MERVNTRRDQGFDFEGHFMGRLGNIQLRCSLALLIMTAMALGSIKTEQECKLGGSVKAA